MSFVKTEKIKYDQPFNDKQFSSERNRIPALYTLNDGSVMVGADMRYGHGSDSPNNIDIAVAVSEDGYTDWEYTMVNYFDDYSANLTEKESASFIDSAIAQIKDGRIFLLCDAYPMGCGYLQSKTGTGYCEIEGKKRMLLTTGKGSDKLSSFGYYIGEAEGELAPVFERKSHNKTEYAVDSFFRLYKNGEPVYAEQKGSEGVKVHQTVFYADSELKCYKTTYLWLKYSDDNGKTWSAPKIISDQVKSEKEGFLGVGPGRGTVIEHNGKERILFCVYDNNGLFKDPIFERASVIYSDDKGETWHRSKKIAVRPGIQKTSESQLVRIESADYKALRIYARNLSNCVAYADSTDGGETWSTFKADKALTGTKNCMVSFIDTKRKIDGKSVILCSQGGDVNARAEGIIRAGLVEEKGRINWISKYHLNKGFFGYSCLTELSDGKFADYYEDEPAHITYGIFSLSDDGEITEINGDNCTDYSKTADKPKNFFSSLGIRIRRALS